MIITDVDDDDDHLFVASFQLVDDSEPRFFELHFEQTALVACGMVAEWFSVAAFRIRKRIGRYFAQGCFYLFFSGCRREGRNRPAPAGETVWTSSFEIDILLWQGCKVNAVLSRNLLKRNRVFWGVVFQSLLCCAEKLGIIYALDQGVVILWRKQ